LNRHTDRSGSGPLAKRLWIGQGCNNHCVTCPYPEKKFDDDGLAKKIKSKGDCEEIIFVGREPTIHPKFLELVELSRDTGYKVIQVVTNGRMFSVKGFAEAALKAGMNEVMVKLFSFDGKTHDEMSRTPGSWKQTVLGIKKLRIAGKKLGSFFEPVISLGVYLTEKNIDHLERTIDFAIGLGADEIFLIRSRGPNKIDWKDRNFPIFTVGFESKSRYEDYCKKNEVIKLED